MKTNREKKLSRLVLNKSLWLSLSCTFLLTGCLKEQVDRWLHEETYMFKGKYDNEYNSDTLEFHDGSVRISTKEHTWMLPYEVDDGAITIKIQNNSMEKRPDIMMRMHGDGEVLTCNVCGKYSLSNTWAKVDAEPKTTSGIK
jgi:hypothetical protein